ncbi:RibD C-terminal domain-containing protein [Microbacterium sp. cf046]|uniref:dihydrofolate reductase family protein n=1 Tax=Microbacterium sp. cf046 TaxID=1761803 RepID=UPI0008E93A01|nr:dihydrofolate reductase family protein [Microbacterium sp. cf046]SFR86232.1 RibD C-terminal domain-containing protein [Microbacterium sp. cf046]
MTGRIKIDLFMTLDGVAQAPGGPEEDTSGGFPYGGWQAPLPDPVIGEQIGAGIAGMDALVLGRRTYDIFAAYWPLHVDNPIGRRFAEIPKYVASRGTPALEWQGARQLGPDAAASVAALREAHEDIHVIGSIDFVHSLLAAEAYDELNLWVYPVVLGQGKKVFPDGAAPANLRLLEPPITGGTAVQLRYGPAGLPTTGDMSLQD